MQQRLSLYCANRITGRGFSQAIRNWKGIEEMSLGPLDGRYYAHIIREIGIRCKKLQVLYLCSFNLNVYVAALIAENLRYLKELRWQNLSIPRAGLHAILSKLVEKTRESQHHQLCKSRGKKCGEKEY
jgi:hypothetical protein